MSAEEFSEIIRGGSQPAPERSMGFMEAAIEGIQAIAPGLSLSAILSDVWDEAKEQRDHGRHEMAAALFQGSGFVMYPRAGQEDDQQPEQPQQDRGGMEM